MALSHLIKYVYNTGSDEVIRRGKKIHAIGYVEMVEHDELMNSIVWLWINTTIRRLFLSGVVARII
jgi:hypothetical protein